MKPPRGRQIVGRVDIVGHAHVRSLDFDKFARAQCADQSPRPLVAFKAHRRLEQAPAQKNRIAAPAFAQRDGGERAFTRKEGADQGVDELGSIHGISPGSTSAPATSGAVAARPALSEEARPLTNFELKVIARSRSASAASTALRA